MNNWNDNFQKMSKLTALSKMKIASHVPIFHRNLSSLFTIFIWQQYPHSIQYSFYSRGSNISLIFLFLKSTIGARLKFEVSWNWKYKNFGMIIINFLCEAISFLGNLWRKNSILFMLHVMWLTKNFEETHKKDK